jgi:hypothetical protein
VWPVIDLRTGETAERGISRGLLAIHRQIPVVQAEAEGGGELGSVDESRGAVHRPTAARVAPLLAATQPAGHGDLAGRCGRHAERRQLSTLARQEAAIDQDSGAVRKDQRRDYLEPRTVLDVPVADYHLLGGVVPAGDDGGPPVVRVADHALWTDDVGQWCRRSGQVGAGDAVAGLTLVQPVQLPAAEFHADPGKEQYHQRGDDPAGVQQTV